MLAYLAYGYLNSSTNILSGNGLIRYERDLHVLTEIGLERFQEVLLLCSVMGGG